jgi:hypothetical protein
MKSLFWSFLLFYQFIFMQGVRFQLWCVFWCSSLQHFSYNVCFGVLGYDILGGCQHFRGACWLHLLMFIQNSTHLPVTLYHVMTEDHNVNFHCIYSAKNIIMTSLGICENQDEWVERRILKFIFINNQCCQIFWCGTIFIDCNWVSTRW